MSGDFETPNSRVQRAKQMVDSVEGEDVEFHARISTQLSKNGPITLGCSTEEELEGDKQ